VKALLFFLFFGAFVKGFLDLLRVYGALAADDEGADDEGADDEGADDEGADDEGADDEDTKEL